MSNNKIYLFAFIMAGMVFMIIWNSTTQPGVGDLKGDFKEVQFYRNENNTGPITRIYAVTVADTLWKEMKKYGEYMPHTKYGNTKVYFFQKDNPVPQELLPGEENFDDKFKQYCIAKFEKDNIGQVSFVKYPD